jgi:hypothetical protein
MLNGLEARGQAIGEARVQDVVAQLAQRVAAAAPDRRVEADADGVTITGPGVIGDPRLIWIGLVAMSAESEIASAVVTVLGAIHGINGKFEGPPVKASAPWIELGPLVAADWGTKDAAGREVRLVLTIRDKAERATRIHALAGAAGTAVEDMARDLEGWRVASIAFVRSRIAGERPGEWVATLEYRVRVLAV